MALNVVVALFEKVAVTVVELDWVSLVENVAERDAECVCKPLPEKLGDVLLEGLA